MMAKPENRYTLLHRNGVKKGRCPMCGRVGRFTFYVDLTNMHIVDETCGRCDRESNCGYHLTPKQFFSQHPDNKPDGQLVTYTPPKRVVHYIDEVKPRWPEESTKLHLHNPTSFMLWLLAQFDFGNTYDGHFMRAVVDYRLGVCPINGFRDPLFFYINHAGRVVDAKSIHYKPDGHRDKADKYGILAMHSIMQEHNQKRYWESQNKHLIDKRCVFDSYTPDKWLPEDSKPDACFYGEHLLAKYPDKPVFIVESEKTALIGYIYTEGKYIFLASGSKGALNPKQPNRLKCLQKRQILAVPDADGVRDWKEKESQILAVSGALSVKVVSLADYCASEGIDMASKPDGYDIGDLIVDILNQKKNEQKYSF